MTFESKRILVTGAQGFIGTNLLLHLNSLYPTATIIGIDSCASNAKNKKYTATFTEHHEIDLSDPSLQSLLTNTDIVIHLAANGNVVDSVEDPLANFNANVSSTLALLEGMRAAGCSRIIFSSTGGALMGDTSPPVNEKSLPKPISPYGASKLACEGYLHAYAGSYDFNCSILRFGNVYGEFSLHKKGVINKWIKASIANQEITIFGDGSSTRDYIHVKDLCDGIVQAARKNLTSPERRTTNTYHLACSKEISLKALADLIGEVSGKNLHVTFKPSRAGEVTKNFAECQLAKKELGFLPKVSLREGILGLYSWLNAHISIEVETQNDH